MLRLMIVDDEQIIREALSSMIDYTSLGYEVIATAKTEWKPMTGSVMTIPML